MSPGTPHRAVSPHGCPHPQEALLVALKSLPPGTLLNMATFGTDLQPLFPSSRLCSNVSAVGDPLSPSILPTRPRCGRLPGAVPTSRLS